MISCNESMWDNKNLFDRCRSPDLEKSDDETLNFSVSLLKDSVNKKKKISDLCCPLNFPFRRRQRIANSPFDESSGFLSEKTCFDEEMPSVTNCCYVKLFDKRADGAKKSLSLFSSGAYCKKAKRFVFRNKLKKARSLNALEDSSPKHDKKAAQSIRSLHSLHSTDTRKISNKGKTSPNDSDGKNNSEGQHHIMGIDCANDETNDSDKTLSQKLPKHNNSFPRLNFVQEEDPEFGFNIFTGYDGMAINSQSDNQITYYDSEQLSVACNEANDSDANHCMEETSSVHHGDFVQSFEAHSSASRKFNISRERHTTTQSQQWEDQDNTSDDDGQTTMERPLNEMQLLASNYIRNEEYEKALNVLHTILERLRADFFGNSTCVGLGSDMNPRHAWVGIALHNIALVYIQMGDHKNSIKYGKDALRVRIDVLEANHPDIAVSLSQLGVSYLECGMFEDAFMAFEESYYIRRHHHGDRHPQVAKVLNNIGCVFFEMQLFSDAGRIFDAALDIQRSNLKAVAEEGKERSLLNIAFTLCNIGSVKFSEDRFDEASESLEEALLLQQSILGDDHFAVCSTLRNIEYIEKIRNTQEKS